MKKDTKSNLDTIGGRLKSYEDRDELVISSDVNIIVRLDGHKFSKFTKNMKKPFDKIFSDTMIQVSKDLMNEYNAYTIYTQSDEITLVLPSLKSKTIINGDDVKETIINKGWTHISGGRTQKLTSLMSGFCTMSFNKHFRSIVKKLELDILDDINAKECDRQDEWNYFLKMQEKLGNAWFDARMYGVNDSDVLNSFIWRNRDCEKNSRSMFASTYCSHKELQNKNGLEQVEFCKEKTGHDWNSVEDHYKYGTFIKKELIQRCLSDSEVKSMKEVNPKFDGIAGITIITRSRFIEFSTKLKYSDDNVKMILSKYKEI
jgi:tRNA(His) guanylyltransferase